MGPAPSGPTRSRVVQNSPCGTPLHPPPVSACRLEAVGESAKQRRSVACRGAMVIGTPVGAQRPALCAGFWSRQAHIGSLERPSPRSVTALQAAFRTSTGSSRSASRYSMRNGRTIGTSFGLPRGGGIAERCAGVRPKSLRATGPWQFPLHPYTPRQFIAPLRCRRARLARKGAVRGVECPPRIHPIREGRDRKLLQNGFRNQFTTASIERRFRPGSSRPVDD